MLVLNADADTGVEGEDLMARTKVRVADAISAVSQKNVISMTARSYDFNPSPNQTKIKTKEAR